MALASQRAAAAVGAGSVRAMPCWAQGSPTRQTRWKTCCGGAGGTHLLHHQRRPRRLQRLGYGGLCIRHRVGVSPRCQESVGVSPRCQERDTVSRAHVAEAAAAVVMVMVVRKEKVEEWSCHSCGAAA